MRRLVALAAALGMLVAPASALAAEPGMTIEVGSVGTVAKVAVNVEVTFACQPKPETSDSILYSSWEWTVIQVAIRQAVGRQQAVGDGELYFNGDAYCTGAPQTVVVTVFANRDGPLFKTGVAALSVSGRADYWYEWCDEWWTCDSDFVEQSASTGWMEVRLRK